MTARQIETLIAWYTAVTLVIYLPLETWASIPYGLLNPFYLIDLVAMALLLCGTIVSFRARPGCAPEILCAAYAWTTANGWRATFDRVEVLKNGGELASGMKELWVVGGSTAVALSVFIVLLILVFRKVSAEQTAR